MNFEQINAARSLAAKVRAAREADRAKVLATYPNIRLTSAVQYHAVGAGVGGDTEAGAHIDAGREPHLIALDALEMGMEPFVAVHDVMIDRRALNKAGKWNDEQRHVGLDLHRGLGLFAPDTLIAWR
jgi:hypothetical protein